MHPSALNFGKLFFEVYGDQLSSNAKIVDIGSQNVNGSLRDVCPSEYEYIGVDFVAGKGVEIILDDPYTLPFESNSIDAVVCSSCFEHSEMFWLVFNEILRILKPAGLLYINVPSNGYVHRYPVDCWRFYPDAGQALVTWAKRSGFTPVLLESFIGSKVSTTDDGAWNDFICVFLKDDNFRDNFTRKILDNISDFENGRYGEPSDLINFQTHPEDFRTIEQLRTNEEASLTYQRKIEAQIIDAHREILKLKATCKYNAQELKKAQREIQSIRQQLGHSVEQYRQTAATFETMIRGVHQSTSWKVTSPLRLAARALRGERPLVAGGLRSRAINFIKPLYWAISPRYRAAVLHWGYRNLEPVFRGTAHYEYWKNGGPRHINSTDTNNNALISMEAIPAIEQIDGRIAIHLHMYYHDLANEFVSYLENMPFAYDLYISVKDSDGESACRTAFTDLKYCNSVSIVVVANRGRDIAPMFVTFGEALRQYDYIAHLHSKKSLYNAGATEGWRQYLVDNLLGSDVTIRRVFRLLSEGHGIVYPQNYKLLPHQANTWLANKAMGSAWCARLGIAPVPQGYFDFPAGSMFWARGDALLPLFNAGITIDDFAQESGQTDGTFAHCLERLLVLSAKKQGFQPGVIKDLESPSWSVWRMDQSIGRPFVSLMEQFSRPSVKYIAFDIFDTLMARPLLEAEMMKTIIAANLPVRMATMYSNYRALAESDARRQKGEDVGLDEIYTTFQNLTRLSNEEIETIRATEERLEYNSLSARSGGVELFEQARATGKPVILISDMFLPKELISKALVANGIQGWAAFYLSNEVGLRKDTGQLYDHVLTTHKLQPNELLMVGDNERSDFQIPSDKGIIGMHILRSTEIARGAPRLRNFVEQYEFSSNLNASLTLGLLFNQNFSEVTYPTFNPGSLFQATPYNLGYSLIGPMLTSMAQWVIETAAIDNVKRLYFLAREGELMKTVYDIWTEDRSNTPTSEYLIVSRRTCSVPLISNMEDILRIARSDYHLNTAENFLVERYGLELSEETWERLRTDISVAKDTLVEVHQEKLETLSPLLIKVADAILAQAVVEKQALDIYLESMELKDDEKSAVVDVGYGGTIQGYLCKLTHKKIDGYYLATDVRSIDVARERDVNIRGCLLENIARDQTAPMLYLRSFELEKLLSSSSAQIMKYSTEDGKSVFAHHRALSAQELDCIEFRDELQRGVLQFAKDAVNVRSELLDDYAPPVELSKALASEFFSKHSSDESELLARVVLDDHYCGRGVV